MHIKVQDRVLEAVYCKYKIDLAISRIKQYESSGVTLFLKESLIDDKVPKILTVNIEDENYTLYFVMNGSGSCADYIPSIGIAEGLNIINYEYRGVRGE